MHSFQLLYNFNGLLNLIVCKNQECLYHKETGGKQISGKQRKTFMKQFLRSLQ